jgi:hypothetical protein
LLDQSNTKLLTLAQQPANINRTLGDEKLYLKGGEGSLSIIELLVLMLDNNGVLTS